ncbi:sensor domain-containing diguanylate cyclase [Deinococcus peraridilitoris]|uniref:Diguanylate cyclase (GGDEF) domain-containing protein n=1 Tax=Deinococcus peraridilitoris (strain DSM 19664 / LMG 22246 / CIP 109416 / KR-200) TaxID=937777 RepID=L0A408_DEIPD|nr:diguanylate cyclase [Deinococcus peraridilitoris]AFZ68154.1 diguanylate cyclase (GGDEF) domain-containing protein [Deinococcus peraridilitoris DSM 19664]
MPPSLPHDEYQRIQALARYQVLDTLPEEAFDRITRLAARVLDVPVAIVNFIDGHRQWGKACYGLGSSEVPREDSFCAWAILSDEVMVVPDARNDGRFADNPMVTGRPHVHLYAGAPLITPDGYPLGTLCVTDDHPRPFGERERSILQDLAAMVIDELELRLKRLELEREAQASALLIQSLRKNTSYAETLLAVSTLLELDLEPREMTQRVVELVSHVTEATWGGLVLVTENQAQVVTAWSRSALSENFGRIVSQGVPRGQGLIWQALERGEALYIERYAEQTGALPALIEVGVQSAAFVPLGEVGGATFVFCGVRLTGAQGWSTQDRALIEAAARSVSVTLQRSRHLSELQTAALTDSFTGLGNRRAFEMHVETALQGYPAISLAVLDIDDMRGLNAREGHARGDLLLRSFSNVLVTAVDHADRVYRLGGDEFAIVVRPPPSPGVQDMEQDIVQRLERISEIMGRTGFEGFSVSVGVASAPAEGRSLSALLRVADERMYRQKRERYVRRGESGE